MPEEHLPLFFVKGTYLVGKVNFAGSAHELEGDVEPVRGTFGECLGILQLIKTRSQRFPEFVVLLAIVWVDNR